MLETVVGFIVCYFVPTIVALARGHRSALAIGVMNVLLGWTVLGWIFALIWSCTGNVKTAGEMSRN